METLSNHEVNETRQRQRAVIKGQPEHAHGDQTTFAPSVLYQRGLRSASDITGRGNASVRAASIRAMQSTYGNRAVQRFTQSVSNPDVAEDNRLARRIEATSGSGSKAAASLRSPIAATSVQRTMVPDYVIEEQRAGQQTGLGGDLSFPSTPPPATGGVFTPEMNVLLEQQRMRKAGQVLMDEVNPKPAADPGAGMLDWLREREMSRAGASTLSEASSEPLDATGMPNGAGDVLDESFGWRRYLPFNGGAEWPDGM